MTTPLSSQYHQRISSLLDEVANKNAKTLAEAGAVIAKSIADGGVLHVFGSGHSSMIAMELVGRAGGLVPVNPIHDATGGWPETLPGYGERLFLRYAESYDVFPGEVVIVVSNSGRNCSSIEVAFEAQKLGAKVIGLTSVTMSAASSPKHPSGKRLFEISDFVLDNLGVPGDALMEAPGGVGMTAPSSTLTGALLMEMLLLEVLEALHQQGADLPILKSANSDEGPEHNSRLLRKFRERLRQPI